MAETPRVRRKNWPPGLKPGVWHPELVGIVPGYPKTPEKFEALREHGRRIYAKVIETRGYKMSRHGVPNGWGRRADECRAVRAQAKLDAKPLVKKMKEMGMVDPNTDPRAEEALEFSISVIRARGEDGLPAFNVKDALAAARIVLDFTKAKPASTGKVILETAESFLEGLAKE